MRRSVLLVPIVQLALSAGCVSPEPPNAAAEELGTSPPTHAAERFRLPDFLPEYYAPAFAEYRDRLALLAHSQEEDREQFVYLTDDQTLMLSVDRIACDGPRATAIFKNILGGLNAEMSEGQGEFVEVSRRELHARIRDATAERTFFAYVLPTSIQIWTYTAKLDGYRKIALKFEMIRSFVDMQRYTEAMREGNVSMGAWGPEISRLARYLLDNGHRKESLAVLQNLLPRFPFEYDAHIIRMENTPDHATATDSARIVFRNAEDPALTDKAAEFLGIEKPTLGALPVLGKGERGLQVILIPLPPCNTWLLEDVARTYEQIAGVPVKIRRLDEPWILKAPERIFRQRDTQRMLLKLKKGDVDFTGWDKDRYVEELSKAAEPEDALSRYYVKGWVRKVQEEPGQYLAGPYLDWLGDTLKGYRSRDERTMYVGMTQANIYSGDNNYVFSLGRAAGESKASILSYHMMLAKSLGEEYQSRQRLIERIAKELIPASLKQLGIPRSTDPTCPYSYSSGVSRLDQKTLNLSGTVVDALNRFRRD